MREYEFKIELKEKINLKHIFECGQAFRFNEYEKEGSYIGVANENVYLLEVIDKTENIGKNKKGKQILKIYSTDENADKYITNFLDLNTSYSQIKKYLLTRHEVFKEALEYGYGIRILKQDLFETVLSFIISANNNISRIKRIIESISKKYGKKILFRDKIFYSFPKIEQLKNVKKEDFRELGCGFRDKYLENTIKSINDGYLDKICDIYIKENDSEKVLKELTQLSGVGDKVANCIMLFGLGINESFPVDVWVKRFMIELFPNLKNATNLKIKEFAQNYFKCGNKNYAGIAQQYLFYWRRGE